MMDLEDLIVGLSRLASADRDWLLAALSPAARQQLLHVTRMQLDAPDVDVLVGKAAADPQPLDGSATLIERIAQLPVGALAQVLWDEPIWFTAALLRLAEWPWRTQLLQRLPHVAVCLCPILEQPGIAASEPLTRALLERIAAKASGLRVPAGNRFESLVQRLSLRRGKTAWRSIHRESIT